MLGEPENQFSLTRAAFSTGGRAKANSYQCNLEDVIETHEVVFAALRSYDTGQPVRLPLTEKPE